MKQINKMELRFMAKSENESFARASVAGFCLQLNPTIDQITDIKTAVSEAVTNSIVHAYPDKEKGEIAIKVTLFDNNKVEIEVRDFGVGIEDLEKAKQPFFTTKPNEERSGMGFTVMESFMDSLEVSNQHDGGLKVVLTKTITEQEQLKQFG